jgi:hypothetical protein
MLMQVAVFTMMMDAVNAGDARRYASLYADDATIVIHGGGTLAGRAAIERYEVDLLAQFPGTRFVCFSLWQGPETTVVHYGVNSPGPGGRSTGHEGLLFYRFQPSGLIATERRYLDGLTPMAQLGMLGPAPARPVPVLPATIASFVATGSAAEAENVAVVRRSLGALNERNTAGFLATVADGATFDEVALATPFAGAGAARAWADLWAAAAPDARWEAIEMVPVGDAVLLEAVVRGTLAGPFGRVPAAKTPFAIHRAAIVHLAQGKIAHMTLFMSGRELAEQVGQWPLPAGK